jgi:hypothetical protein
MNDVYAPIKNISADGSVSFPSSIPILSNGRPLGGILRQVVPVGRSLVRIYVSAMEYMVDEGLQESLASRKIAVCRLACHLGAGVLPAEVT